MPAKHKYGWHRHDYHKVLYCVAGSIVFHVAEGDVELHPATGWIWVAARYTPRPSVQRAWNASKQPKRN